MLQGNPHNSLAEALEAGSRPEEILTLKMIIKVWQTVRKIMGYNGISEYSPIWNNKYLHELLTIDKNKLWERCGVSRLIQLYEGDTLKSFEDLRQDYGIPNQIFYSYLQIRHSLGEQFSAQPLAWSKISLLQKIIKSDTTKGLIAEIYAQLMNRIITQVGPFGSRDRWEADVGQITDVQWKRILELGPETSISPSQKALHLLLLHRAYYTPKKLYMFGCRPDDECPRCLDTGDSTYDVEMLKIG